MLNGIQGLFLNSSGVVFTATIFHRQVNKSYVPTTRQIVFNTKNVTRNESYTLRIALASATLAEIQVYINNENSRRPHFSTGKIGRDNAIARHGIHGLYNLYNVNISGSQLVKEEIPCILDNRAAPTRSSVLCMTTFDWKARLKRRIGCGNA